MAEAAVPLLGEAPSAAPPQPRTDYKRLFATMETPRLISEYWERTEDPAVRDRIVTTLVQRGEAAWPSGPMATREEMAGLYPDPADPQFAARLFSKREFYEARAVAAAVAEGTVDPCTSAAAEKVFELTPVQRIVSRFMHPLTPYNGMLLFHGVGVGKTCSAVTIAEQFLEYAPNTKVIVLAPQALQDNFKRTVVDPLKFSWDEGAREWVSRQCTGTSYLDRLGLINNPDLKHIQYKVEEDRRQRYTITGYQAFANWIRRTLEKSVPAGLTDPVLRESAENEVLRRLFSDHLIIIDEAHNLREGGGGRPRKATAAAGADAEEVGADETPSAAEAVENAGGKALNPYLRRIALNTEGMRLVLMTATPMYNSAPEIVHMLNFLILNDTKSERSQLDRKNLFTGTGKLMSDAPAVKTLERVARRYVSYMRGENPYTFPIRMRPAAAALTPADEWPTLSATRRPIQLDEVRGALNAMPLVFTDAVAGSPAERLLRGATRGAGAGAGAAAGEEGEEGVEAEIAETVITDSMLDFRMQMANITYPNDMYGVAGWDEFFQAGTVDDAGRRLRVFSPRDQGDGPFNVDTVFAGDGLRIHGPKIHRIVKSVTAAQGICFVYSRYIKAGALPLAIALERAGFQRRMPDGRIVSLLGGVAPVTPVCALCGQQRGTAHEGQPHAFAPATYVLLTSESDISPNFAGLVRQAASWPADPENGPLGTNVKVVIGSQVASEGLDLKCIREMHVLDAWYHLNRTDQIIGRAIRYCSHTALRPVEARLGLPAMSMNNCLIYLHALRVPDTELGPAFESADMYAYRIAIEKALMVGEVQRLLKKHAWDCNLELEAITFAGLPARDQIDAQGRRFFGEEGGAPKYSIDDVDFTTYCDYQRCAHECALTVARTVEEGLHLNSSTYSATDARRQVVKLQDVVRHLFDEQVIVPESVIQEIFGDLPWEISSEALMELIDGRKFRLRRPDGIEGFLVKKAGYLVFQPAAIRDTEIPITLRYARAFQLQRQFLTPQLPVFSRIAPVMVEESGAAAPVRPPPALATVSAASAAAGGAGAGAVEEPAAATGVGAFVDVENLLHQWAEWVNYIETAGAAGLPRFLSSTVTIWGWIIQRYAAVPQAKLVAFRWFFDRLPYDQQRGLYEFVMMRPAAGGVGAGTGDPIDALVAVLAPDIFRSKQIIAYRIYNPDVAVMGTETWCRSITAPPTEPFRPCSSTIGPLVNKQLGDKAVPIPGAVGTLFGFIAAKKGRTVFKTLDTTKAGKLGGGAECGNTSNLGEHRPRIRLLHEAGRSVAELGPLMLPDSDEGYDTGGARKRAEAGAYEHLNDITHQPLCMYMEFLCRLLDIQRVGDRRWYLSAVEAAQSGLKGKK